MSDPAIVAPAQERLRRQVFWHRILARRGEPADGVSPEDFELGFDGAGEPGGLRRGALAYCADLARERLLFTVLPPGADVFDAAFLYSAQLAQALGVVSVPFERLGELGLPEASPRLIFSPGRAGSTLLARLLRAAGAGCASEPDWPTQLCCLSETARGMLGEAAAAAVARAGFGSLVPALGAAPFVKLRSQCNARPEVLAGAASGARTVFLFRERDSWALSRHRAFGEPPEVVAQILRDALVAVDRLRRAGRAPAILWFEALVAAPERVLAGLLGRAPEAASVARVMGEDAQAGTGLERRLVRERGVEDGFLPAFAAEWSERRPAGRLGERLADLLERF